jgi:hypothetical protein
VTYNSASRKDVRAAEKAQALSATINREVICGIMQVQNGRQWMYERLAAAYVFADPFSPDPAIHAYQAGLRAAGIGLFNDIILYAAESFTLMIREHNERSAASERSREPSAGRNPVEPDPDGIDYDPTAPSGAAFDYADGTASPN